MAVTLDSQTQAAKFLYRATFGPKGNDIAHLMDIGVDNWFEEQFNLPLEPHLKLAQQYRQGRPLRGDF